MSARGLRAAGLAALACATALATAGGASAATVYEYRGGGHLQPYDDPAVGPGDAAAIAETGPCRATTSPTPALRAAASSVSRAISRARARHQISSDDASSYTSIYAAARKTRGRLGGTNRAELSSVVATLERIAARGQLTGGRMPALFLQLRRNTEFWGGHPKFPPRTDIPAEPCQPAVHGGRAGARITFPGSQLIFQYYPGQGLQLQPLGNFGKANGLYGLCSTHKPACDVAALRKLLDELVAIRSGRGGFTTWEYWFYFSGGTPPWTSGMADATAIQALARGGKFLHVPAYLKVARSALGVFSKSAPVGVRVRGAGGGADYLLYSFSTGERVLNAFMQTLNGLYDYYRLTGDKRALRLFHDGDRSARREMRSYDTGAWTRYSLGSAEASLNYQEVATGFVRHLCKISKISFYCHYGKRFDAYLHSPTRFRYKGARSGRSGHRLALAFTIDKVSCVTAKVENASGHEVFHARTRFAHGRHAFAWTPRSGGTYRLAFSVLDPNRNHTDLTLSLHVK